MGELAEAYDPALVQPARPGDGDPMITRRTKIQLLVFALITLLGVSYVGARYARLDRLFFDETYTVVAHLARLRRHLRGRRGHLPRRPVGRVEKLVLTDDGVDADLDIENGDDDIPADTLAVVGNRSAVGEQYVELQPQTDTAPYLGDGSEIAMDDTRTPIATEKLLADISTTVESVDKDALATTVIDELGHRRSTAPARTCSGSSTPATRSSTTADANFDVTTALIRDSNTVLHTQVDKAERDPDLRPSSSACSRHAGRLRQGPARGDRQGLGDRHPAADASSSENRVDLGELINNLVTTGDVIVKHLPGIEQILVIYPYVVEGGFTVVSKSPDTGLYDAHFGLVLTRPARSATRGYEGTDTRPPQDGSNRR